jgi:alpha-aminoadipate carrier protein LysW
MLPRLYYIFFMFMTQMNKIVCPDCEAEIKQPEGLMIGDILECGECGTEVEILSLEPLQYKELIEEK